MSAATFALTIDQGDDETADVAVKLPDGSGPQPLSGATLYFNVTPGIGSATRILEKNSGLAGGITITDANAGLAEIEFTAAETAALAAVYTGRQLNAQLEVKDASNNRVTLARGTLLINRDLVPAP